MGVSSGVAAGGVAPGAEAGDSSSARSFTSGIGTVVTGRVSRGVVAVGDTVELVGRGEAAQPIVITGIPLLDGFLCIFAICFILINFIAVYAGVSTYLGSSHEKTTAVNLSDERVFGAQGMVGAAVQLTNARLGVEYSIARVPTLSLKVGFGR